jgi:hypothetical protein
VGVGWFGDRAARAADRVIEETGRTTTDRDHHDQDR